MIIICNVPDEVVKSVKMGTWCGSSVTEKMIANSIPLEKIRTEIEQLPTHTRTNWDGCCPDIDYPQIEYVDVTKDKLLSIIDKYMEECDE